MTAIATGRRLPPAFTKTNSIQIVRFEYGWKKVLDIHLALFHISNKFSFAFIKLNKNNSAMDKTTEWNNINLNHLRERKGERERWRRAIGIEIDEAASFRQNVVQARNNLPSSYKRSLIIISIEVFGCVIYMIWHTFHSTLLLLAFWLLSVLFSSCDWWAISYSSTYLHRWDAKGVAFISNTTNNGWIRREFAIL